MGPREDAESASELAHTSTLAQTREHPSEITVRFAANNAGCTVNFEHGGWVEGNASYRAKFRDWPIILRRFASVTEQTATDPNPGLG
jgi:hypothetical protein